MFSSLTVDQIPFLLPVLAGPSMWMRAIVIIAIVKSGCMPIVFGGSTAGVIEFPDEVAIRSRRVKIFLLAVFDATSKAKPHLGPGRSVVSAQRQQQLRQL